ncbi:hypothetical protein KM295_08850 [Natronomonas sp. F2-12]|uniref:Uncharacterized protein n=1 Tax=Natronomonas aquatica TaxID=2841590 RepID=A0A9R1D7L9_9EURY|nr:hypothetical protein [Natronomonas aquatica]
MVTLLSLGQAPADPDDTGCVAGFVGRVSAGKLGEARQLLLSVGPLGFAAGLDDVADPVGQDFVLFGTTPPPEIVGDTGSNSVTGDFLTALPDKQNKRLCLITSGRGITS